MVNVQRAHWSYVVLQCLLLSLLLCRNGDFAERNKYYHMSTLCVQDRFVPLYKMIDGAVLTSESENELKCVVTFQTDSILQRFMLRFERLALDCNDHLYVFDGDHAYANYKADLSCRSTRADVGTIFTQSNFVTLKYVTDEWSQSGNGFKLIITAFKDSAIGCRDFRCLNNFCISQELMCDGVNHCGDNSDETSHADCVDKTTSGQIMGLGVSIFVAIIVSIIIVCFICVVGIAICLCRRQGQHQQGALQRQHAPLHPLGSHPHYPTAQTRYSTPPERLGEKPPPYPGNVYSPATGIGYDVPHESLYYPTK
ncbi:uncharacterized protein LOC143240738 isoform X3 [Tachypleus tridentatus]|uniref:uncharacterized protein LOC143240738 isoform X3 n=1 Tax=Tachypleus tridentatus TaxID=6853 RepID=UPI003FD651DA